MTKDSPSPADGGRAASQKPANPGPAAAAALEEQRRELEKLRAELEAERARGREERRRFSAGARQLRQEAERERQQLADHLRSQWEAQRSRELRQLREDVLREREAEIRQLLRWKEAEMRQLQQVLRRERDGVARQARELQRQLAEELLSRGYGGGRARPPEDAGARCRCRLQEVLAQLRWETHGEQASRIRHLQAALDVERRLFLKYILEHFHWNPALPSAPDPPLPLGEPPREAATKAARGLGAPDSLSAGVRARSRSLDRVPAARARSPDSPLPARARSLDSLAPEGPRPSLDGSPSHPRAPESSSPDASLSGSLRPLPPPPPPPSERQTPSNLREGEEAGSRPLEAPSPPPPGPDHRELLRRNSELSEALQELARRCSSLREENLRLRRLGLPDEADEKAKQLKGKRAELTGLARRLEDRARKLQEANLRAVSAPVPGESLAGLELCQALAFQRARGLSEQASALLAKDKQIEELRQECHLLQARVASGLGPLLGEGAASAQWLSIGDLDRLQRESQREVLRLQWQLTLQQAAGGARAGAGGQSASCEAARRQVQALERQLSARRQECEELGAQVAAAHRRGQEAEAQLQVALREGAWLAKENARLQAQADWTRKVAAENEDVRGQLGRACRQRDAAGLLAEQLLQQVAQRQDWQQQLQRDLQKVLCDLQAAQDEIWTLQCQPGHPPRDDPGTELQLGPANPASPPPSGDKQGRKEDLLLENPAALGEPARGPQAPDSSSQPLDSRPQPQRTGSQSNSSSEVESTWATVPSCPTLDADTASEAEDLEPDSLPSTLEAGGLEVSVATPKLKIFLARYSYNPYEGPNEHPESELPLTPGAHVYVFGDMDKNGFYEGELEDGRRGLVPSNLVEQIPDGDIRGCLPSESPGRGPTRLPAAGQGQAWKDDPSPGFLPGQAQTAVNREPCPVARVGSRMEVATEVSDTTMEASRPGAQESRDRRGSSNAPPGTIRIPHSACVHLHLLSVSATSAEVAWVGGSHPHTVYLDNRERALTPMGVNGYTFRHLQPGTRHQARVEVHPPCDSLQACQEVSSTVTFETPLAGPPHPPLDVLVERHASPGLLVVSWLPVTIDPAGSSNGVPVTGYAVYADGLKVAEVAEATAGSTLLELSQLPQPATCQKISVRTMSLCGESLDSVPTQIPHDCVTCLHWPEMSPFSYTWEHPSAVSGSFPICPRRLGPASLSAKARPRAPRSCGEPRAKCREAFPEEPPRRWSPETRLISEGEGPSAGSSSQAQGPAEARKPSRKDQLFEKRPQNHRPPLLRGQPGGEGTQDRWVLTSPSPAPGVLRLSPEPAPGDEPCQEKATFGKVLRQKADAITSIPPKPGGSQQSASDFCGARQEDAWGAEGRERRPALHGPSTRGQALGAGAGGRLQGPGSAPCPARSSKALGTPRGATPPPGTSVGPLAGIFATLPDYEPPAVSTTPEAAGGELALRKGQPRRAGGSQDPHSFCHSECSGLVGSIAGHLVAEVDAGREWTDGRGRWHLPGHLDDFGGLAGPQGSSPLPQGSPGRTSSSLWTPKTVVAALDYDPGDWLAGGPVKGQLSLRAGDVVTVHGPVDDKGFYYGELGGHRGLVPAHLLDHMSLQE